MTDHLVEMHALRVLLSTMRQNLMPELSSALAKDRAKRADAALLRLVAGFQQLPAVQSTFAQRYASLLERANALPTLMTLPMVLFILPTIILIIGGPAALKIIDMLAH